MAKETEWNAWGSPVDMSGQAGSSAAAPAGAMDDLLAELLAQADELDAGSADSLPAVAEALAALSGERGRVVPMPAASQTTEPTILWNIGGEEDSAKRTEDGETTPRRRRRGAPVTTSELLMERGRLHDYINEVHRKLLEATQPGQTTDMARDRYLVFSVGPADFAVPIQDISEVGRIPSITAVPNTPEFVRGLTNLRGEVMAVLHLPLLLGLEPAVSPHNGRILYVRDRERLVPSALLVDGVKGIRRIPPEQVEPAPPGASGAAEVVRAIQRGAEAPVRMLDLERLFRLPEVQKLQAG